MLSLVVPDQTLVFYMSLQGLPIICNQMIAHGMAADTPVALIEKGTTLDQKTYVGSLSTMPTLLQQNQIQAPTICIVGSVVTLHQTLGWFSAS